MDFSFAFLIDIILEHINERQHPKHFTHDLNWEADFSVATVMSHRELFSRHQPIDDFDAKELLDLVADTISLKISLLNNPNSLSDTELLESIKPALLQNAEYVALAGDYIVDQSHHRYREVSEGWLKLTI